MAKITFASMKLKQKNDIKTITPVEGVNIEVSSYLPVEEKISMISIALQKAEENGIYNPIKLDMYFHLFLVYEYTNITFTDKQREDERKLYDILKSNGIIDAIVSAIPDDEYNELYTFMQEMMADILSYRNTVAGVIRNIIADLPRQAEGMQQILDNFDPEKFQEVLNFAKAANGGRDI